jgi:hypothetical protein
MNIHRFTEMDIYGGWFSTTNYQIRVDLANQPVGIYTTWLINPSVLSSVIFFIKDLKVL